MYAVVTSGGKQYRVEPGSTLTVERLTAEAGASVTFDRVLLVGDGETITVGVPTVDGAHVTARVLGEALGPKIVVFKFKQKVKYRRRTGHRQHLTRVRIEAITANGKTASAPEEGQAKPAKSRAKATGSKPARATAKAARAASPKKPATRRAKSTTAAKTAAPKAEKPASAKGASAKSAAKADTDKAEPKPARRAASTRKPKGSAKE